jgi:hypothetical protein
MPPFIRPYNMKKTLVIVESALQMKLKNLCKMINFIPL